MSFNDLSAIYAHFQALPLGFLNPTDRALIIAIARQPDGCFIGEDALAAQVGTSVGNLKKVIGKVRKLGIVYGDQRYARRGLRQCYRVNVIGLGAYVERVSVKTPFNSLGVTEAVMGDTKDAKGVANGVNGYPVEHPYKQYKQYKNDKDEKLERFNFVTKDLPSSVRSLIRYGSNISDELDNLIHLGISLEAVKAALEKADFSNAHKVGGLFLHTLRGLKDSLTPTVGKTLKPFEPRNCDICASECKGSDMPIELFNEGVRCNLDSESLEEVVMHRNGLY